jgi:hypothetical protein
MLSFPIPELAQTIEVDLHIGEIVKYSCLPAEGLYSEGAWVVSDLRVAYCARMH